jgi:hypothetical protein
MTGLEGQKFIKDFTMLSTDKVFLQDSCQNVHTNTQAINFFKRSYLKGTKIKFGKINSPDLLLACARRAILRNLYTKCYKFCIEYDLHLPDNLKEYLLFLK